jgi:hypothetical protein
MSLFVPLLGFHRVHWTEAGEVRDLIKAVPEAALQKLGRLVTSGSRLNVQFFTNGSEPSMDLAKCRLLRSTMHFPRVSVRAEG